jgi:hypothetical protein
MMFGIIDLTIVCLVIVACVFGPKSKGKRPAPVSLPENARWEKALPTQEIATVVEPEWSHNQREYYDRRPYPTEPIRIVMPPAKTSSMLGKIIVIAVCVGYILCPLDIIPDFIPIIGFSDDIVAGLIGLRALLK